MDKDLHRASHRRDKYRYSRLPSGLTTRILELKAGKGDMPLECQLRVVDLSKHPPPQYEAISYFWGDPIKYMKIDCNEKFLPITSNLWQALKTLRDTCRTRNVWADAVCIDQDDQVERGFQVGIMKQIYSKAERVLVWLGEDARGQAKGAFAFIEELEGNLQYQKHILYDGPLHPSVESRQLANDVVESRRKSLNFKSLDWILQKPWFQRIWVVQEVSLAKEAVLICGEHTCNWEKFANVVTWVFASAFPSGFVQSKNGWAHCACLRDCLRGARKVGAGKQWWNEERFLAADELVCQLYVYGRLFSATERSDLLYATLWHPLWSGLPDLSISPDYAMAPATVFMNFTLQILEKSGRCTILSLASISHREGGLTGLPSWVARWDDVNQLILPSPPTANKGLDASRNSRARWSFLQKSLTLQIDGIFFDVVISRSTTWETAGLCADDARYIHDPEPFMSGWLMQHEWYANEALAVALTAICACSGERVAPVFDRRGKAASHFAYEIFVRNRRSLLKSLPKQNFLQERDPDSAHQFHASIEPNRCIFSTEHGSYGNGPPCTQAGDFVCVLFGGKSPLLLRSFDNDQFRVVGDCYVDEIMHGELMDKFDRGETVAQSFNLV